MRTTFFTVVTSLYCGVLLQLEAHWGAYSAPVTKGEIKAHDLRALWRNIEPLLRKALETVYLREITR